MENLRKIFFSFALFIALSVCVALGFLIPVTVSADAPAINVWWPTNGAHVSGIQPFKAMIPGIDASQYQMFWQVDGGQWNWMDDNSTDSPHKEASVDVSGWSWHGSGPYTVNFIARDQNGVVIAQQSETIYVDNGQGNTLPAPDVVEVAPQSNASTTTAAPLSASASASAQVATSTSVAAWLAPVSQNTVAPNSTSTVDTPTGTAQAPLLTEQQSNHSAMNFYVVPNSEAARQEAVWQGNNSADAAAMQTLAGVPTATWFGNWNTDVRDDVHSLVDGAQASNEIPVLVAYNIPERDCGGFSSGGSDNPSGYQSWIDGFAAGLGQAPALVILEPDALAQISCLSQADQSTREELLSYAVNSIKKDSNAKVYIDAGHSDWIDAKTMAQSLQQSGIAQADGFSLNVSNFMPTQNEISYGEAVSSMVGGKHFVIDTSRNGGNVASGDWCNPLGAAIGSKPTEDTGNTSVDAYLWVKTPGESDGSCNGGPSAGTWWPSYALSLVQN
ncbi:MAG TPA: glycoside hydrolase family 6 protein [Candidatus Paceibacterota bacterium]|nr:glycoside hydrolase family 6 protein [Candidatus Paceibacterota bacterium]